MPELPEVEAVVRSLRPKLRGAFLERLRILDDRLLPLPLAALARRRVRRVERRGKNILLGLDAPNRPELWLAVHLRMTGKLVWAGHVADEDAGRIRARFELDGEDLLFVDTRRFGTIRSAPDREAAGPVGIDPLSPDLSGRRLASLLVGSRQALKAWLLRQDRLAGLGNIYASEILHAARLHPEREAGSLTAAETTRLLRTTRRILRRAIEAGGTTVSDYRGTRGQPGTFQVRLKVYGRDGEPCRTCRSGIVRTVTQGRSTFHCPRCQRL